MSNRVGVVMCGSFCTLNRTLRLMEQMVANGMEILPIMSYNVSKLDTRFYKASDFRRRVEDITGCAVIDSIAGAEPIGPKELCDILVVLPCTGNTLAKIANGITDTPATMAVKSHIRNNKPVVIALASNDGLGASYQNIAKLYNTPNFYFVPYRQDDEVKKPKSLVYVEDKVLDTIYHAIKGEKLPPLSGI